MPPRAPCAAKLSLRDLTAWAARAGCSFCTPHFAFPGHRSRSATTDAAAPSRGSRRGRLSPPRGGGDKSSRKCDEYNPRPSRERRGLKLRRSAGRRRAAHGRRRDRRCLRWQHAEDRSPACGGRGRQSAATSCPGPAWTMAALVAFMSSALMPSNETTSSAPSCATAKFRETVAPPSNRSRLHAVIWCVPVGEAPLRDVLRRRQRLRRSDRPEREVVAARAVVRWKRWQDRN